MTGDEELRARIINLCVWMTDACYALNANPNDICNRALAELEKLRVQEEVGQ